MKWEEMNAAKHTIKLTFKKNEGTLNVSCGTNYEYKKNYSLILLNGITSEQR